MASDVQWMMSMADSIAEVCFEHGKTLDDAKVAAMKHLCRYSGSDGPGLDVYDMCKGTYDRLTRDREKRIADLLTDASRCINEAIALRSGSVQCGDLSLGTTCRAISAEWDEGSSVLVLDLSANP